MSFTNGFTTLITPIIYGRGLNILSTTNIRIKLLKRYTIALKVVFKGKHPLVTFLLDIIIYIYSFNA